MIRRLPVLTALCGLAVVHFLPADAHAQWRPYYGGRYDASASIRIQVKPRQTEVFVDGYYAGTVDEFDGVFQRLHLEAGEHEIQLYLAGHRLFSRKLYLQPTTSSRIAHDMVPLGAGEPEPARPTGGPLSERPARDDEPWRRGRDPRDRDPRGGVPRDGEPRDRGPATDGFGSLALRVQPQDAEILIDGNRWQGSGGERLIVQLGAGTHTVEIRKEGYRTYVTEVAVRPGETATLNVAMTAASR